MPPKRKNKNNLWIGGTIGFLIGIGGNLVAAWIQQDLLSNSFTPLRVSLIILCSLLGIVIVANLEKKQTMRSTQGSSEKKNFYSKIKLAWSKLRTRGQGIHVEDVSAIGSDIDIDAK